MHSDPDIFKILTAAGVDPVKVPGITEAMKNIRKDIVPARPNGPRLYDGGPFSMYEDEITSLAMSGGSPVVQWIPTGEVKSHYEVVNHLSFVTPRGFDGSDTYPEWLASIDIGECGYGPSTNWSGFSYRMDGGSFSWTTDTMQVLPDGMKYFQKFPSYTVRGSDLNMLLSSDKEWAVARVMIAMEQHLDYVVKHGNRLNSDMEWDGLDQVIRTGYVASRTTSGLATWADPIVVNAATFTTVAQTLNTIRILVRRARRRAAGRNWGILPADMAIVIPAIMWDNLAEYIAAGAMYAYTNTFGFSGQQTFQDFRQEYRNVRQGGLGYGTIDIDGTPVPVLPDVNMGEQSTFEVGGTTVDSVTGDVYILTRRAGGNLLLQQQYVNWSNLDYPAFDEEQFALQGGFVRAGWINENNKCYYYYAEMAGRLATYMQPMQARINNVTVPTLAGDVNEASSFISSDFQAYNSLKGGQNNVILSNLYL